MPIYQKKRKVKVKCKKCGREFTITEGGYGDVIGTRSDELINFTRDMKRALTGDKCPHCGYVNKWEYDLEE